MSSPFGTNDLADPSDLTGLSGAPFTDAEVDAGVAAVRNATGWHIAPVRADTAILSTHTQRMLRLPTRNLVSVEAVWDVLGDAVSSGDPGELVADTTYRILVSRNAVLRTSGYWLWGLDRYEVEFHHGYSECPPELLPVIAEAATLIRRDVSARTLTAGPFTLQVGVSTSLPLSTADTLDRYRLVELGAA